MISQFLAPLNQTYIAIHNFVERGEIYKTKLLKAIEELKKKEEQRKKLGEEEKAANRAKVTLESELTKLKAKALDSAAGESRGPPNRPMQLCHSKWQSHGFREISKSS